MENKISMMWSDLESGDKIKFTKECLDFYSTHEFLSWAERNKGKVFIIHKIELFNYVIRISIENESFSINLDGSAYNWLYGFNKCPIEIIELGE